MNDDQLEADLIYIDNTAISYGFCMLNLRIRLNFKYLKSERTVFRHKIAIWIPY